MRTGASGNLRDGKRCACNEAQMKHELPHIDRFDIDGGTSDTPPRRQSNVQELAPGYLWNGTTQELIPILPEDHPDYRQNQEIVTEAIRRWGQGASK